MSVNPFWQGRAGGAKWVETTLLGREAEERAYSYVECLQSNAGRVEGKSYKMVLACWRFSPRDLIDETQLQLRNY